MLVVMLQSPQNLASLSDEQLLRQFVDDRQEAAFAEIVQVTSFNDKPKVFKIDPYQKIPIRPLYIPEEEL